jgi:hypothetical protein
MANRIRSATLEEIKLRFGRALIGDLIVPRTRNGAGGPIAIFRISSTLASSPETFQPEEN